MLDDPATLLLAWFDANARDLPWRRSPTPWRVFVAETMLQQTRIAAVLPRFESFLARFPDPTTMANADVEEVLALWSGLGYYRRARNLHAAAAEIRDRHQGRVPDDPLSLRALTGVGAYTAGAVASIAFGRPEPIVDGNVERVLARLFVVAGNVKRGPAKKRLWELSGTMVRSGPPARVNQAMMELGALVCLPRSPRCGECPLEQLCGTMKRGDPESLPELPAPRKTEKVRLAVAVVTRPEGTLLVRAPEGGFLAGTWMPPFVALTGDEEPRRALETRARHDHDLFLSVKDELGSVSHTITWHRIVARVYRARLDGGVDGEGALFVPPDDEAAFVLSSLAKKSLLLQAR